MFGYQLIVAWWRRLLIYLLPGVVAAVGMLIGLLSTDHVKPVVAVLTVVLVGLGFIVPPVVDRLTSRHQRVAAVEGRRDAQLREHFQPRGRGILPTQIRRGSYFTGRGAVLTELTSWLDGSGGDARCRVVTGNPGSGKSAVLGHLAKELRRSSAVAVHARAREVNEVADEIATGLGLAPTGAAGLLAALRSVRRRRVVIVDAVDEALQPYQLIQDLLEPLAASSNVTGLQCLFGSRRGGDGSLLRAFGATVTVLDLDAAEYLDGADVATYVRRTLLAETDPDLSTPYRCRPDLAWPVADAVAQRAGPNFLVAQLTALALMTAKEPVDLDAGVIEVFPASVGAAMDRYLREVEPDHSLARDLLTVLAWSEGEGLVNVVTWAALATALGTAVYTEQDVERLLRTPAVDLVTQSANDDGVAVRMFHEALAEHLRANTLGFRTETQVHRRIAGVLVDRVPVAADGARDWSAADRYTRRYLAIHAAAGRCMDGLLAEPGYLVVADAARLLPALASTSTTSGRRRARLVERIGQQLLLAGVQERVSYLEMAARMAGDDALAAQFGGLDPDRPWRVAWARWVELDESQVLGHYDDYVLAVQVVDSPRGVVVLAAGAWAVRAWWLCDGARVVHSVGHPHAQIRCMAAYRQGDDIVVLTTHADGEVWRAMLFAGTPAQRLGRRQETYGLWTMKYANQQILVQVPDDRVAAFDAETGQRMPWPAIDVAGRLVLAVASVLGRPLAVIGWPEGAGPQQVPEEDRTIQVWDLATGRAVGRPLCPAREIPDWRTPVETWSAALASIGDRLTVLIGGSIARPVFCWRPENATPADDEGFTDHGGALSAVLLADDPAFIAIGDSLGDIHIRRASNSSWRRLAIHDNGVAVMAAARVGDDYVLVTGGRDGTVRLIRPNRIPPRPSPPRYRNVRHAAQGPDATPLIVVDDGARRHLVLDSRTGDVMAEHPPEPAVRDLTIVPSDPPLLVTLHSDNRCTVRPALEQGSGGEFAISDADWCALEVAPRAPHTVFLCASDGTLAFIDPATGREVRPKMRPHATSFSLVVDPVQPTNGLRFVTATMQTPEVLQWTLADDGEARRVTLTIAASPAEATWPYDIFAFAYGWHGNLRILAGGGSLSHFQVWNADRGDLLQSADLADAHHMTINAVEVGNLMGQTYLLTGGHTCTLGLWSLDTHQERHLWVGSQLWSIKVTSESNVVLAGVRGIMNIEFRKTQP